ncbi:MAG: hypothetical protein EA373_11555, partial [Oceanospirillales bacterium]
MSPKFTPLTGLFIASLFFTTTSSAQLLPHYLTEKLSAEAPELNQAVLNKALLSMQCATNNGLP